MHCYDIFGCCSKNQNKRCCQCNCPAHLQLKKCTVRPTVWQPVSMLLSIISAPAHEAHWRTVASEENEARKISLPAALGVNLDRAEAGPHQAVQVPPLAGYKQWLTAKAASPCQLCSLGAPLTSQSNSHQASPSCDISTTVNASLHWQIIKIIRYSLYLRGISFATWTSAK